MQVHFEYFGTNGIFKIGVETHKYMGLFNINKSLAFILPILLRKKN